MLRVISSTRLSFEQINLLFCVLDLHNGRTRRHQRDHKAATYLHEAFIAKKHKDVTVVGLSFILEPAITSKYVPFVGQYIMWRKCRIKSTKVNLKVDYVIFWRFSQFMVVGNLFLH